MKRPETGGGLQEILQKDPFVIADWYGKPEDRDVCEPLIRALEDPDEIVREVAVNTLISLNDFYAASPILGVLLHGSVNARIAAAEVMGEIATGDQLAIQYLTKAMSDPDGSVRSAAARALSKIGGIV